MRTGKLQVVLAEFEAPPRPISVVYPHARFLPARTRVFIDWIKQNVKLPQLPE
ncbi:MAG TPA: LysR substrate-binding domain-containing protein [Rhodocyclaceae bacterium]|nr:LysR substrate-binding domain-containing protein [Rhodocyclaceae bacterium]